MRYFLKLSYNGQKFCGWQYQKNARSVQEELEYRFSKKLGYEVKVTGCGRTDTGVHAKNYIAHLDLQEQPPSDLLRNLNLWLNQEVVLHQLEEMQTDAHARFSALSRSYIYHFNSLPNAFTRDSSWYVPQVEWERAMPLLEHLKHVEDFTALSKINKDHRHYRCCIQQLYLDLEKEELHITANRFVRGMVRLVAGAIVAVARGQQTKEEVVAALEERDRSKAAAAAPAHGLFFTGATYPQSIYNSNSEIIFARS